VPTHLVRRIVWGLAWRWSILFVSLITQAPPAASAAIAIVLAAGLVAAVWRRRDLLGSTWRLLLAIAIVNLGFWLGGAILVPAITLAIVVTFGDLWWSIIGTIVEGVPADTVAAGVTTDLRAPLVAPDRLPDRVGEPRRRRASRGRMPAGLRLLVAACLLIAFFAVTAPAIASRASEGLSAALSSINQRVNSMTAAAPAVSSSPPAAVPQPTPTPSPPGTTTAVPPNQQPAEPAPNGDAPGYCVSLPDGRYEIRLPNGQVIVVTTRHHAGCPDLASILKALRKGRIQP
jgi:hypothetical protein